jgi:hypothetical protein
VEGQSDFARGRDLALTVAVAACLQTVFNTARRLSKTAKQTAAECANYAALSLCAPDAAPAVVESERAWQSECLCQRLLGLQGDAEKR